MRPDTPERLEESDIASGGVREQRVAVRPELRRCVASMSFVAATGTRRVFLPDAFARILVVREPASGVRAYLVGPRAGTLRKDPVRQDAIVVRLSLGAVPSLMSTAASEIAGAIVPLAAVWGDSAHRLVDDLAETSSRSQQREIVERALLSRARGLGGAAVVPRVLAAIDIGTDARVSSVARRVGVSERHLRRIFHEAVGLSPKAYVRVARLRRALGLARRNASRRWTSIAVDAGYFDQAHMVAEFRHLTGRSPTALVRELDTL